MIARPDPLSSSGLGPISFAACTALDWGKQLYDFGNDIYLLYESTRMTRDMLARVNAEIAACPGGTERRVALENIRSPLALQLDMLVMNWGADIAKSGLFQVAEGMIWQGVCGLAYVLPIP